MIKKDLVERVAKTTGFSIFQTERTVEAILMAISEGIARDGQVILRRFGTFLARKKKQRMGRNPKTGEPVVVSSRTVTMFHPSKVLKALVNGR